MEYTRAELGVRFTRMGFRHSLMLRQVWRNHTPLCVDQIGLVSRNGAAMLLSSDRRPHDESKVGLRNPLESRRAPWLNHFQKTAADKSPGD